MSIPNKISTTFSETDHAIMPSSKENAIFTGVIKQEYINRNAKNKSHCIFIWLSGYMMKHFLSCFCFCNLLKELCFKLVHFSLKNSSSLKSDCYDLECLLSYKPSFSNWLNSFSASWTFCKSVFYMVLVPPV